jgi:hypothetical protein
MAKRARFDGPEPEINVYPPGDPYAEPLATVKQGHLLPADAPAAIRDELLQRPNWTAVDQASGDKKES